MPSAAKTELPRLRSNKEYIEKQAAVESNARSYPRKLPIAIVEARGMNVKDADGKVYLDCLSNAGTLALGHNHPVVVEAIQKHLESGMPMQTLDLMTPTKQAFIEELWGVLPPEFARHARIQFCGPSGSDAVEAALKLVKTATGRRAVVGFCGAYHGQTHGALAMMGNPGPKERIPGLMPDAYFLPYPYPYRMAGGSAEEVARRCAETAEQMLQDHERGIPPLAGMILEPVQGEGGAIPAPAEWLQRLRRLTAAQEIPLIFDEVQTGFARTGKMFSLEHSGVIPDVLVLSKAIGGGLPLAVVLYHERLDVWLPGAHAGTFRGNQLAMATGTATIRFLKENQMADYATEMGLRLTGLLLRLKQDYACIGEVRSQGLMIGVEIIKPGQVDAGGYPAADGEMARVIQRRCLEKGLILELGGRHGAVMRLLPPLIITLSQVDRVGDILHDVFSSCELGDYYV